MIKRSGRRRPPAAGERSINLQSRPREHAGSGGVTLKGCLARANYSAAPCEARLRREENLTSLFHYHFTSTIGGNHRVIALNLGRDYPPKMVGFVCVFERFSLMLNQHPPTTQFCIRGRRTQLTTQVTNSFLMRKQNMLTSNWTVCRRDRGKRALGHSKRIASAAGSSCSI